MARLPDWIECKRLYEKDGIVYAEIKSNYVPMRLIINLMTKSIIKFVGWKIWLYPKVIRYCLNNIRININAI